MPLTLRDSRERIADPRNLDDSVDEVFRVMLGVNCRRDIPDTVHGGSFATAVVGFGGMLSGACVLRCDAAAARQMAAQMIGAPMATVDGTVKDAIGEICNMLAGAWKSKVPELAAHCGLSVPAVITGADYQVHVQAPEFELRHVYSFGEYRFEVTILCDGLH